MSNPEPDARAASESGHPLFPRPENAVGPDPREIEFIQIRRIGPDGKVEICPKSWRASDLRTLEQVHELYGGGVYQFVAQGKNHAYTAWSEKMTLGGASKKFVEDPPAPTVANVPPGYYGPQMPFMGGMGGMGGGMAEIVAMMRTAFEANAALQATMLKLALEQKQGGSADMMAFVFKAMFEKQMQSPLESLKELLPVLQALAGGGNGNPKQFMQGVEFATGFLEKESRGSGGGNSKGDEFADLIGMAKWLLTTVKGGGASEAKMPKVQMPAPAAEPQVQTDAPAKPKKRKSRPPVPPGYAGAPPFGAPPFQAWPWPNMPAQVYGMMQDPAFRAWVAAYAQAMFAAQTMQGPAPMPQQPMATQAVPPVPPIASPRVQPPMSPQAVPPFIPSWIGQASPVVPTPPPGAPAAPISTVQSNVPVQQIAPEPMIAPITPPPVPSPLVAAVEQPQNVVAEQTTVVEPLAVPSSEHVIAPQSVEMPASRVFDPFAQVRPMLAELYAEAQAREAAGPVQAPRPPEHDFGPPRVEPNPALPTMPSTAMGIPPGVMSDFTAGLPFRPPLDVAGGVPPGSPMDIAAAFALCMASMASNRYAPGLPMPAAMPGVELADDEEDDDEDEDDECDDAEDEEDSAPTEAAGGSAAGLSKLIAMAAADPEFESVVPEEMRPMLRDLLGKGKDVS